MGHWSLGLWEQVPADGWSGAAQAAPPLLQVTASFQTPRPVTGKTLPGGREGRGLDSCLVTPGKPGLCHWLTLLLPMTLQKGHGQTLLWAGRLQRRLRLQTKVHTAWRGADRLRAPQLTSLLASAARKQSHVPAHPFPPGSGCLNARSCAGAFRNETTDREPSSKVERKPSPDLQFRQGLAWAVLMD